MSGILTKRQGQILDFIREHMRGGSAPSFREIQKKFGFASPNSVNSHLKLLEKKGALRREPGQARNISLPEKQAYTLELPVLGMIPAGMPADQEEQSDRCITVDLEAIALPKNTRNTQVFALETRGDSMINAGILDRDIVIMERIEPRDTDIVAALIDGECTLKRYLVRHGKPFLRAENPNYPDLIPARELVIQGVFRALIRIASQSRQHR
ncbi:MAG: transcriptional repressor LexA [Chthoniobacterales bacterium]